MAIYMERPQYMRAWFLNKIHDLSAEAMPLQLESVAIPEPRSNQLLIQVLCCGVCHTELDEIEGRTPPSVYPIIPGHQVVGKVTAKSNDVTRFSIGERVGVAWIFRACGECEFCRKGHENLCPHFSGTGRDAHGGYAEYMTVDERFAYAIPSSFAHTQAAPLLCAGAIGYRSLMLAKITDGNSIGLSGFGASGHLVLKTAKYLYPHSHIYVWSRSYDEQCFARELGCDWAGDFSMIPPSLVNVMIDTTPAWQPVLTSLRALKPGGRLIINAIRKESHDQSVLSSLIYHEHLWMEKEIKSVANITRKDVEQFLKIASVIPIRPEIEVYPFEEANAALVDLKHKHVKGAKVLLVCKDD
ncbi:zinc-dependent alcohol dehydrogenase family protein [Ohtaekwangia kribbensis]|jgi:propanol-preferring alcohol dehydrogenase